MVRIGNLDDLKEPMTEEEHRQAKEALVRVTELRERMLAERGGVPFSPSEDILAELRNEHYPDAQ